MGLIHSSNIVKTGFRKQLFPALERLWPLPFELGEPLLEALGSVVFPTDIMESDISTRFYDSHHFSNRPPFFQRANGAFGNGGIKMIFLKWKVVSISLFEFYLQVSLGGFFPRPLQ